MKAFLQDVNQRLIPWFSDTDISPGERWELGLATQLETTEYGIVCVTQESLQSAWTLFEAGALSKSVKGGRVCPYLIDITRRQLTGPLSQFQAKEANSGHTWEMLQSINLSLGSDALPEARLKKYFDTFWPDLEAELLAVNRELQPLPELLQRQIIDVLPQYFYQVSRIEMFAFEAELPVWKINLNQAALYVWREVIQIATIEKRLEQLFEVITSGGANEKLRDLQAKVRDWTRSLKPGV